MKRQMEPEVMDQPGLDPVEHRRALDGLARIHRWSGTVESIAPVLERWAGGHAEGQAEQSAMRVLDLACGGGHLTQALHDAGPWIVDGADMSEVALAHASATHGRPGAWRRLNVFDGELPRYDAIIATFFVHHLTPEQAVDLLRRCAQAAPRLLVHDLTRSQSAKWSTWLATRLISRSRTVHVDGPRSVAAAYTSEEMRDLFRRAGLQDVEIVESFPFRMTATWERP